VPIQYIFEGRQGVHYARNTAAKASKGEVLYFTDDDMIADRYLLKNLLKVFDMGMNVGSATGRVLPKWEAEPPEWILKYCSDGKLSLYNRPEELIIAPFDIGVWSCHQAMPREVFFKTNGFHPENTAGEWIGDGETGLNMKINELGYRFAYTRDSVIYHIIPPERLTQRYLNKRMANQGNAESYTAYRKHRFSTKELYIVIVSHARGLLVRLLKSWMKLLLLKDRWRMDRAFVSYYFSRIKYDFRLIKDERWRELVLKNDWLED
jgi:glycosyltransferase involved in cell wall biosynthesis